ncbi:MAG: metallophosphoesterase [Promethearchaeota archaeon]
MVKLHVLSDLHVEFGPFDPPDVGADVLVVAVDVAPGRRALSLLDSWTSNGVPAVFVLGNHEFYGGDFDVTLRTFTTARIEGVHILENEEVVMGGVRLAGATLWTEFAGADPVAMEEARRSVNDFHLVRRGRRKFTPMDALRTFRRSAAFLSRKLAEPFAGPTVVVTHHLPTYASVAPRFAHSPLNPAFASNLDWLVEGSGAAFWIHGHSHVACDHVVGATRVLCNPRGYAGLEAPSFTGFDPALSVDLDIR